MNEKIAEMDVIAVHPDGRRVPIQIEVGRPYADPRSEGTWRCPVSLGGLDDRLPDIAGVGSFQALCLAINLIRRRLLDTRDEGVRFITVERGEEFELPLAAFFPDV
jgi:hypothetical protein